MFIGHYAPALAAAALPRAPRLGVLFLAAQLIDIVFFGFVLLGVEHMGLTPGLTAMSAFDLYDMPWTHSLIGACGWAALFAIVVKLATRDVRAAWIGAGVVVSHWLLDWLVHAPDLTLLGSGPLHGLGLWDHPYVAMPLELALTAAALTCYVNATQPRDWRGTATLVALTVVMTGFQLYDWLSPEPTQSFVAVPASVPLAALSAYTILTVLAWWTGSTRERA